MNSEFWSNRIVLVTGHTGFKGAWITLWLKSLGAEVIGYSLPPPTVPSLFKSTRIDEAIKSIEGDIRNLDQLNDELSRYKPDVVIHMAAQSLVRYSYRNPIETFSTNILGTANVMEAVRHCDSVRVLLNVTSDKCYENREWIWGYRESDSLGGHDPYSCSKACAELITAAYRDSFFSGPPAPGAPIIASARAGNVIGGGDWAEDRLIPDIVRAFMDEKPIMIRCPNSVRPWQHVLDPLCGYLMVIEKMWTHGNGFDQAWNFGPLTHNARSVRWVVERMIELWGGTASMQLDTSTQFHEAGMLSLDCSKARAILGWTPKLGLDMALEWTVEWYKAFQRDQDMRAFSLEQIDRYQRTVITGQH